MRNEQNEVVHRETTISKLVGVKKLEKVDDVWVVLRNSTLYSPLLLFVYKKSREPEFISTQRFFVSKLLF